MRVIGLEASVTKSSIVNRQSALTMDPITVRNFAIALFIGALIGLEREKRKSAEPESALGGLRTFILLAMAGAVSAWLSEQLGEPLLFGATVVLSAVIVLAGYVVTVRAGTATPGLTTEIAALVTVLLGGLAIFGWPGLAVGLGITTSAVLAFKGQLHGAVRKLGEEDLYAGLKLLIATFVILPVLPDRTIDPLGALNPRQLWLLVIFIAALSLVGYVAVRALGQARGSAVTGLLGGMVSSTAVTLAFSRRSREDAGGKMGSVLAAAILFAWLVMFARVVTEVFVVHRQLLASLAFPMVTMAAVSGAMGLVFLRGGRGRHGEAGEVPFSNPFSLTAAIKFAILFAAVLAAVALAQRLLPPQGMLLVAGVAGLTDVDAITLSMATFARDGGDPRLAARAITVAALTNTAVKAGMVLVLARPELKRRIGGGLAAIALAGLATLLV